MKSGKIITIDGANVTKAVRLLHSHSFPVGRIKRLSKDSVRLFVYCEDGELFSLFSDSDYKVKIEKSSAFRPFLRLLLSNSALILTFVFFGILTAFFSSTLQNVSVSGLSEQTTQLVCSFVSERFDVGALRPFDERTMSEVRSSVLENFACVTHCEVYKKGVTLFINALENENVSPETPSFVDIVSEFDGVIRGIVVESGTPAVSPGSRVAKGDTLIFAYHIATDGGRVGCEAKGIVYAETDFVYTETVSATEYRKVYGERTETRISHSLFGVELPDVSIGKGFNLSRSSEFRPQFEHYEVITKESYLFPSLFIPLVEIRREYVEVVFQPFDIDVDENRERLEREAFSRAETSASGVGKILSFAVSSTVTDGGLEYECRFVIYVKLCL